MFLIVLDGIRRRPHLIINMNQVTRIERFGKRLEVTLSNDTVAGLTLRCGSETEAEYNFSAIEKALRNGDEVCVLSVQDYSEMRQLKEVKDKMFVAVESNRPTDLSRIINVDHIVELTYKTDSPIIRLVVSYGETAEEMILRFKNPDSALEAYNDISNYLMSGEGDIEHLMLLAEKIECRPTHIEEEI